MIFNQAKLADAYSIELEKHSDVRGFFSRTYCRDEFAKHGLESQFVQMNTNCSARKGTVRGLHWQESPHSEAKLIRCLSGEVFDVIADMRPTSPTYMMWQGFHLTRDNRRQVYVPGGCAHAFLSLTDDAEIAYLVSSAFAPGFERGARYDDPALAIAWPIAVDIVSDKDLAWPDLATR